MSGTKTKERQDHTQMKRLKSKHNQFVKTGAFYEAKQILECRGFVTVLGPPGSGKTSLAEQLLLDFSSTHDFYKLKRIKEWKRKINQNARSIVALDDVFGASKYDKEKINMFEDEIKEIKDFDDEITMRDILTERKVLFIFTSRNSIFKEAEKHLSRNAKNVIFYSYLTVDLGCDYKLSTDEKASILRRYINSYIQSGRNEDILERSIGKLESFISEIANIESPIGFPQCVYMFFNDINILQLGQEFFKCPRKYICNELDRLYNSDRLIYAFLVLLALINEDHKLSKRDILYEFQKGFLCCILQEIYPQAPELNMDVIKTNLLKKYDGVYLKINTEDDIVGLHHISYLDSICYSYSEKFPSNALERLPYDLSVSKFSCRTRDKNFVPGFNIHLESNNYNEFALRMCKKLASGNLQQVCKHVLSSHKEIARCIVKTVVERNPSIFQLTERNMDSNVSFNGSLMYWSAVFGSLELCKAILEDGKLNEVNDKLWLRTQASATLVHACKQSFGVHTVKMLCEFGADPCCRVPVENGQTEKELCNYCQVHFLETSKYLTPFHALVVGNSRVDDLEEIFKLLISYIKENITKQKHAIIADTLGLAICHKRQKVVNYFLESGCAVDANDTNGLTPLWFAVLENDIDLARRLIRMGASVNTLKTSEVGNGMSLLMVAKSVLMVNILLVKDQNLIDILDSDGRGALHTVQCPKIAEVLIDKGMSVNMQSSCGNTPLHSLRIKMDSTSSKLDLTREENFRAAEVARVMLKHGADVCIRNKDNKRAIEVTTHAGVVKEIIDWIKYGFFELNNMLAMSKDLDVIDLIIQVGARSEQCQEYKLTEESKASSSSNISSTTRLTSSDEETTLDYCNIICRQQVKSLHPLTPLFVQTKLGSISKQMLHLVYKYTKDLSTSMLGDPLSHLLTLNDKTLYINGNILHQMLSPENEIENILEILEEILKAMSRDQINSLDEDSNTPLHLACSCFEVNQLNPRIQRQVVDLLVRHGADSSILNGNRQYAAHCLFVGGCGKLSKILKTLLQNPKLDIDHRSKDGMSLLRLACNKNTLTSNEAEEISKCVHVLLHHIPPATFNTQFSENGDESPLMLARRNNIEIVGALLNNVETLTQHEIEKLIKSCITAPGDLSSWKIIRQIISTARNGRIVIKHLPPTKDDGKPAITQLDVLFTQQCMHTIAKEAGVNNELVSMMLCDNQTITNDLYLDKYMLYYLISCVCCDIKQNFNADANYSDSTGKTALMKIFEKQKMGSFIKTSTEFSTGKLVFPVTNNVLLEGINLLIERGACVNSKDSNSKTVLQYCITCERGDIFVNNATEILLSHGANSNEGIPLIWAIHSDYPRYKVMRTLLEDKNIDNRQCWEGKPIIYTYVEKLINDLSKGVILGGPDEGERTIKMFARMGLQLDATYQDESALQLAFKSFKSPDSSHLLYKSRVVQALIQSGANVGVRDNQGRTLLHLVVTYNKYHERDLLKILVHSGCDLNAIDKNGYSVLQSSTIKINHDSLITALFMLDQKVDVHHQNEKGNTVLHTIVEYFQLKPKDNTCILINDNVRCSRLRLSVLRCLLNFGADPNKRNLSGKTPLDMLVEKYSECNEIVCNARHLAVNMISAIISVKLHEETLTTAIDTAKSLQLEQMVMFLNGDSQEDILFNV